MASFGRFTDHAPPTEGLLEVRQQLRQLRSVLLQVLLAQHRGETVPLDSKSVLELLDLPPDATEEMAQTRLVRAQASVTGMTKCHHCGGAMPQLEGVEPAGCPWCGKSPPTPD
jgi:hypothetical protein